MLLLLTSLTFAQETPAPPAGSVLLQNARLIDGTGAAPRSADLLIIDGVIAQIGEGIDPAEAETAMDLAGASVTPGLIDSHVHITFSPGQGLYEWDQATKDEHIQHHLRAYVAAGVTTVLDCAGMWSELDRVQGWLDEGMTGPRLLTLGEPPTIAGGYGPEVLPDLPTQSSREEIDAFMDSQQAHGAVGVKLLWAEGVVKPIWEMPADAWWASVAESAAAHELPMFAHAMSPEETLGALEMQPRALLHGLNTSDKKAEAALADLAGSNTYVVATLNISASSLWAWDPVRFEEPLLGLLAHPDELAAVQSKEMREQSAVAIGQVATPGVPAWVARWLGSKPGYPKKIMTERMEVATRMAEAGVPLVVGSDAPGWPLMLDNLPAYSTIREMELFAEIGLTPEEVLTAATSRPAEMLYRADEIGTLQEGYAADLVVHSGDPLTDIEVWRSLSYVMREGEIRTPEAWMVP